MSTVKSIRMMWALAVVLAIGMVYLPVAYAQRGGGGPRPSFGGGGGGRDRRWVIWAAVELVEYAKHVETEYA